MCFDSYAGLRGGGTIGTTRRISRPRKSESMRRNLISSPMAVATGLLIEYENPNQAAVYSNFTSAMSMETTSRSRIGWRLGPRR